MTPVISAGDLVERLKARATHCAEAYGCEEYLPMRKFWADHEALSSEAAARILELEGSLKPFVTAHLDVSGTAIIFDSAEARSKATRLARSSLNQDGGKP